MAENEDYCIVFSVQELSPALCKCFSQFSIVGCGVLVLWVQAGSGCCFKGILCFTLLVHLFFVY